MNNEKILTSDPLDLLFQNRNKMYGAYMLRKTYPNRIKTSLLLMLGLSIVFSAFTFLPEKKIVPKVLLSAILTSFTELAPQEIEKPKPKQIPRSTIHSQRKFVQALQLVNETDSAEVLHDITDEAIGSITFTDLNEVADGAMIGAVPAAVKTMVQEPAIDLNVPSENPDIQASYPGGEKELVRFLQKNLRSPNDLNEGESVVVRVRFVVAFDGALEGFDVVKDGGEIFNQEVVRVLMKMPKWNPGKKGGQNIPVYYTIPVKFTAME